jgi:hypothetical protein
MELDVVGIYGETYRSINIAKYIGMLLAFAEACIEKENRRRRKEERGEQKRSNVVFAVVQISNS